MWQHSQKGLHCSTGTFAIEFQTAIPAIIFKNANQSINDELITINVIQFCPVVWRSFEKQLKKPIILAYSMKKKKVDLIWSIVKHVSVYQFSILNLNWFCLKNCNGNVFLYIKFELNELILKSVIAICLFYLFIVNETFLDFRHLCNIYFLINTTRDHIYQIYF